jgi:hypothetical protein
MVCVACHRRLRAAGAVCVAGLFLTAAPFPPRDEPAPVVRIGPKQLLRHLATAGRLPVVGLDFRDDPLEPLPASWWLLRRVDRDPRVRTKGDPGSPVPRRPVIVKRQNGPGVPVV